jgi:DNA-directed RNA polymerase alpha subunit
MNEHHSGRDMELSVRALSLAKRIGASTVRELAQFTADELLSAKCFGETSLREIQSKLAERGLRLGMTPLELDGKLGARGNLVAQGQPPMPPPGSEHEHEAACCGHCEEAARRVRERAATGAGNGATTPREQALERKLNMSLTELELSIRTANCLESESITTVRDLVIRTAEELLEVRNTGPATVKEVKAKLAAHGLRLGMNLPRSLGPDPDPKRH